MGCLDVCAQREIVEMSRTAHADLRAEFAGVRFGERKTGYQKLGSVRTQVLARGVHVRRQRAGTVGICRQEWLAAEACVYCDCAYLARLTVPSAVLLD